MDIKAITNSLYFPKEIKGKKTEGHSEENAKDKLVISPEAKLMQTSSLDATKLNSIRERIENKFYDKKEVVDQVASSILKELNVE
ncbi:MAG: hypothetical protein M0P61_17310 [Ignavibacteriaceae bacterium]|jgi:hypothetical protein|nr:hypothetical protein [Ignavibacteriaceae bacterium]